MKRNIPFTDNDKIKKIKEIIEIRTDNSINDICDDITDFDFLKDNNNDTIEINNNNNNNNNIIYLSPCMKNTPFDVSKLISLTYSFLSKNVDMITNNTKDNTKDNIFESYIWNNIQSYLCSQNNDNIQTFTIDNLLIEFNNKYRVLYNTDLCNTIVKTYFKNFIEIRNIKLELINNLLISQLQNHKIKVNLMNNKFNGVIFYEWSKQFNIVINNCKKYLLNLINDYNVDNHDFIDIIKIKYNDNKFLNDYYSFNIHILFEPLNEYKINNYIEIDTTLLDKLKSRIVVRNKLIDIIYKYYKTGYIV